MGRDPLRRACQHLPEGRRLDLDQVPIRHHGIDYARSRKERLAGGD